MKNNDYCGSCCFFKHEDTDGWGICYEDNDNSFQNCGTIACPHFISNEQMRHHVAVLIQSNRYRRDKHVPAIYRMPDPKELGKAIDFAVKYLKTFSEL